MIINNAITMETLLKDGYTRKFANMYLEPVERELKSTVYDKNYVKWAHSHGFLAESAYAYGLNEDNYNYYLSDYDYYLIWPLNSWEKIWIDDKMTLKYMLADTEFDRLMPKYYYYNANGKMMPLLDNPYKDRFSFKDFFKLLTDVKEIACKPCNGMTAIGFFKLSFRDNTYYYNDKRISEEELEKIVLKNSNYVFTEYIHPSKELEIYSPLIHTLRIVVLNKDGYNPTIIGGYFRIPSSYSKSANYIVITEEIKEQYNIFLKFDFDTGKFGPGKLTYIDKAVDVDTHPDLGIPLSGQIKDYEKLKEMVLGVARRFNNVSYMGFDIGVTNKGFKCMEINSHPGIKYMQLFNPLLIDDFTRDYYLEKISAIKNMSIAEKKERENIK